LLYSCGDSDSSNSATDIIDIDNSHSIETSSSNIRSSSSSEPDEDKTYSSSKAKLSSSSTEKTENSSSVDQKNSSNSKKSSSSKSKSKSSSSGNSKTKSSSSNNSITSSSSDEHCNSEQISSSLGPYVSPIRMQPLTAKPNANKSEFTFTGGAFLERPCIPEDTYREPYFTSVELVLAYVNELGQNVPARITIQYTPPTLPAQTIDFVQMGVKISDSAKTQCGNFKLFVILEAKDDSEMDYWFVSVDSIEFVREPIYCEAESSSSAEIIEPKVELRKFTGNMSTSETRGYSFKEDGEVPIQRANIRISMDELKRGLTLHGVNGYKVVLYDNNKDKHYNDDWNKKNLPPSPVYTTDFRFTEAKLANSVQNFDFDAFWIVIGPNFNENTGEDFYAVTLKTKGVPDANGAIALEIIYYKK
ncbi:MAG: hypothetical protein J5534_08015, partial [Fibrobacter sp.]|nr:hypothetical protein [Fibrobacter sp.]